MAELRAVELERRAQARGIRRAAREVAREFPENELADSFAAWLEAFADRVVADTP